MTDRPEDAPSACPGTKSDSAGKSDACAGCPNQKICAEGGGKREDPDLAVIANNLSSVKHRILVLSGKGGVGKSSVAAFLAQRLAAENTGGEQEQVAVLDVDICGPSQARIFGVEGARLHKTATGLTPVFSPINDVTVVSIAFLLQNDSEAVIWRGDKKTGMIKQFLRDVDYGDQLDYLIVDTPPGTSDEHLAIAAMIKPVTGAVLVTTPQQVSWDDVRREADFCRKVDIPILGLIVNMADFSCPKCHHSEAIFPEAAAMDEYCKDRGIPILGRLPLDPLVGFACDSGVPIAESCSPQTVAVMDEIIVKMRSQINQ